MMITRRDLLAKAGSAATLGVGLALDVSFRQTTASLPMTDSPPRGDFAIPRDQTYLNSAYVHPMPVRAAAAVQGYLATRTFQLPRQRSGDLIAAEVKLAFARLINASPASVCLVQSTSVAENLVVNGLGLPGSSNTVVTDALHFDGSLVLYGELARRGLGVSVVRPRNWRITIDDLAAALDSRTKLVAVSLVSWYNGFQHDLAAVCQLAHARGAYVYADIVQAAGNTPIDVQATGVDFCGCSTFKWLMGDFGLGFLYVREDLLDRVIHRTQVGYQQADVEMHYLASDPPADQPITWALHRDAAGHFEVGTYSQAAVNALAVSLPYLQRVGVASIHESRQPLLRRLHEALPRLGWTPITPPETTSALVTFTLPGAESRFAARLQAAKISVSLYGDRMRVSPAIFNSPDDIETLIDALA
ncbi:MAG TPA: aminotransferase class V-fold PLP-dependent enzyme [Gemmatimonadales bacterium]|nr:aminotransferase class V-fold PLP-dependent enzyme [Gemmatimonadales bacterium]